MIDVALNELIGAIYDATIQPELWHDAIERIRKRYLFQIAMLAINQLPDMKPLVQVSCNVPTWFMEHVGEYVHEIPELWGGLAAIARLPLEEPIVQSQVYDFRKHPENRWYAEWSRPQGLVDQVVIGLVNDPTAVASLGMGVHESRPPITTAELDELRIIAPHLRRAATISNLLGVARSEAASFRAAFDTISSGVLLVGADVSIRHANRTAEEMLRLADPVRSARGRLRLVHDIVPGRLEEAVRAAATLSEIELGRRGMSIPTRRSDGTAVSVHVMPLERRTVPTGAGQGVVAAVFVADGGAQWTAATDAIAVLHDLTPAEARVLELVVAGRSSQQIAQELGIATSTLRTHLLRVFDKTGRHSRAELVRLAGEFKLPV
jgi:DNA-binding CsgD family transcriptional regulator/PAS domain-containing protein